MAFNSLGFLAFLPRSRAACADEYSAVKRALRRQASGRAPCAAHCGKLCLLRELELEVLLPAARAHRDRVCERRELPPQPLRAARGRRAVARDPRSVQVFQFLRRLLLRAFRPCGAGCAEAAAAGRHFLLHLPDAQLYYRRPPREGRGGEKPCKACCCIFRFSRSLSPGRS